MSIGRGMNIYYRNRIMLSLLGKTSSMFGLREEDWERKRSNIEDRLKGKCGLALQQLKICGVGN
jgi:hypothetical protein